MSKGISGFGGASGWGAASGHAAASGWGPENAWVSSLGVAKIVEIKAALKTIMGGVTGLSATTIHARTRPGAGDDDADFAAKYVTGGIVNGWEIESESGSSKWAATNKGWDRRELVVIRGWFGCNDSATPPSSDVFDMLVQKICEAVNADQSLGGAVRTHETAQTRVRGHEQHRFKVLCHYVEIAVPVVWTDGPRYRGG